MRKKKRTINNDRHYGTGKEQEAIILFKGLNRQVEDMDIMARYLNKVHGYYVTILDFPKAYESLTQSTTTCAQKLHDMDLNTRFEKTHFVGASRGGLIIRKLIEQGIEKTVQNLDSCVMLGTPNQGSQIIDMYRARFWAKPILTLLRGKEAHKLRPGKDGILSELRDEFPSKKAQLGIIAGFDKFVYFPLKYGKKMFKYAGLHDGIVGVKETFLKGAKAHLTIPNLDHIAMESDIDCLDQIVRFIKTKKFDVFKDENRKKKPLTPENPLLR